MGSDQIHLEAVEHLKRINQITLSLRNNDTVSIYSLYSYFEVKNALLTLPAGSFDEA